MSGTSHATTRLVDGSDTGLASDCVQHGGWARAAAVIRDAMPPHRCGETSGPFAATSVTDGSFNRHSIGPNPTDLAGDLVDDTGEVARRQDRAVPPTDQHAQHDAGRHGHQAAGRRVTLGVQPPI